MTDQCLLPSAYHDGIGTPDYIAFAAQYLACTPPYQRECRGTVLRSPAALMASLNSRLN